MRGAGENRGWYFPAGEYIAPIGIYVTYGSAWRKVCGRKQAAPYACGRKHGVPTVAFGVRAKTASGQGLRAKTRRFHS